MNSCKKMEDDARWEDTETNKYTEDSSVIELQRSVARAFFVSAPSVHRSRHLTPPPIPTTCSKEHPLISSLSSGLRLL